MPSVENTIKPNEESSCIITASFYDENDVAVAPDTMTWSLVDEDNNIINNRNEVSISSPETSEDIVLSGDDLSITSGHDEEERYLVLEGTYTSDAGSGLPLKDHLKFYIQNIKKVS